MAWPTCLPMEQRHRQVGNPQAVGSGLLGLITSCGEVASPTPGPALATSPGSAAIFVAAWMQPGSRTRMRGARRPGQHLGGVGLGRARVEPTARAHARGDRGQHTLQPIFLQADHEASGFAPTDLSGLDGTVQRIVPAAQVDEPLLDDHRAPFGVDFTQNPPGVGTAPAIHLAILLPLAKQSLDLPSGRQQREDLLEGEQATGDIGQDNVVGTPEQALFTHLSPFLVGFPSHMRAPLLSHLLRDPLHQQPHGQVASSGEQDPHLQALSHLFGSQRTQIEAMVAARLHTQTGGPAREEIPALRSALSMKGTKARAIRRFIFLQRRKRW